MTPLRRPQVEMKRLNIPPETPCAVRQWEGLIAGKGRQGKRGRCTAACGSPCSLTQPNRRVAFAAKSQSTTRRGRGASRATCG